MQFLILGYDRKGEDALKTRLALREAHLAVANRLRDSGNLLFGVAMLDENEKMCGSMLVTEFASRDELDRWLEEEPYVIGKVWQEVKVTPCKVGPMFSNG